MKTIFTSFFFIALAFIGCKQNTTSPTETKEIWPLKVGNYWVMKTTNYDSLGNITKITKDSMAVIKDTIINNEQAYMVYQFFLYYAMNRADGFYMIVISWNNQLNKDTIFYDLGYKYPGTTGETYTGFQNNMKIITTDTVIHALKDGSFNCYEYYHESQSPGAYYNQFYYISPGVGSVYSVHHTRQTGGKLYMDSKSELQSYWVK